MRTYGVAVLVMVLFSVAGCGLLPRVIGRRSYMISSVSMEPTLKSGTRVTAELIDGDYVPRVGDIVVFTAPEWGGDTGDRISRVIGTPGSQVECCDGDQRVVVNGQPLDEPYLGGDAPSSVRFAVTVPSGRLWVMSDHRDVSRDSREHQDAQGAGTIAVANVVGVVK
jgi:signal peptidase I